MRATEVAKQVAEAWNNLPPHERAKYEEMARADKERYNREKAAYAGPWRVPSAKNPTAPRRPASSFLAFSNERRRDVVKSNPDMSSGQVSGLLSKMWREAPTHVRERFREEERQRREQYKQDLAEWSKRNAPNQDMPEQADAKGWPTPIPLESQSNSSAAAAPLGISSNNAMAAVASLLTNYLQTQPSVPLPPPPPPPPPTQVQQNDSYASLLPLLYQSLAGCMNHPQAQPRASVQTIYPQASQLHLRTVLENQLQALLAPVMQQPSQTATSYATFPSATNTIQTPLAKAASAAATPYQNSPSINAPFTMGNTALFPQGLISSFPYRQPQPPSKSRGHEQLDRKLVACVQPASHQASSNTDPNQALQDMIVALQASLASNQGRHRHDKAPSSFLEVPRYNY